MNSLARLLKEKGMTHNELHLRSGVSRKFITQLACGSVTLTEKSSVLAALAWALDVPPVTFADISSVRVPLGPRPPEGTPAEVRAGFRYLLSLFRRPRCYYTRTAKEEISRGLINLENSLPRYELPREGERLF